MSEKLKISAVSYLNTIPFVYGLKNHSASSHFDLSLDVPSECARKLRDEEVDIALIPVAEFALSQNKYEIVSDYCIGAKGEVKTVLLVANNPINEIEKIYLDPDSMTSIHLLKILAKEHWEISPKWITDILPDEVFNKEAALYIGDKAFGKAEQFPFVYDLSKEWKKMSGLPFVFACWASRRIIPNHQLDHFQAALHFGIIHSRKAIKQAKKDNFINLEDYLNHNISFELNEEKRKAMNLFLTKLKSFF